MSPGGIVAVGFWGVVAGGCAYGLAYEYWDKRRYRKTVRLLAVGQPSRASCTPIRDLARDQETIDFAWPRPRSVADPLTDELERLFNAPPAPEPRTRT